MKKTALVLILVLGGISLMAQNKTVDKLFDKYAGQEGFTSVVITKHMFSLFSNIETKEDDEYMNMMKNLENIRILSGPEGGLNGVNFYDDVISKLPEGEYKELMVIQDSGKNIKFLIKEDKDVVAELLMVVGGGEENVLISITGKIDMKAISKLSKSMGIEGMENLDKFEGNKEKN